MYLLLNNHDPDLDFPHMVCVLLFCDLNHRDWVLRADRGRLNTELGLVLTIVVLRFLQGWKDL